MVEMGNRFRRSRVSLGCYIIPGALRRVHFRRYPQREIHFVHPTRLPRPVQLAKNALREKKLTPRDRRVTAAIYLHAWMRHIDSATYCFVKTMDEQFGRPLAQNAKSSQLDVTTPRNDWRNTMIRKRPSGRYQVKSTTDSIAPASGFASPAEPIAPRPRRRRPNARCFKRAIGASSSRRRTQPSSASSSSTRRVRKERVPEDSARVSQHARLPLPRVRIGSGSAMETGAGECLDRVTPRTRRPEGRKW